MIKEAIWVLKPLYFWVLLASSVISVVRFRKVDKATKFVCRWIGLGAITELSAWYSAWQFGTNLPVYNIYSLIEFVFIVLYFNETVLPVRKYRAGTVILLSGVLLWFINIICLQPLTGIGSNFIFFEGISIVCLGLYGIYRKLTRYDRSPVFKTHFWIPCIFIFYQCGVLWNWGAYDYFLNASPQKTSVFIISILTINTLVYIGFVLILLLYPKMKRSYVF